jgi:peptidoglycan hydrolase CwlO-like protein
MEGGPGSHARRRLRAGAAVALSLVACLVALPVGADNGSGSGQEQAAQQALNQARAAQQQANSAVASADAQLQAAKTELAQAQAQLDALQQRINQLDAKIAADQAEAASLEAAVTQDKQELAAVLRAGYESSQSQGTLAYVVAAGSINDAIQRIGDVSHVVSLGQQLVAAIDSQQAQVQADLSTATLERQQAEAAALQAQTQEAVIAADEASAAQLAAQAAWVAQQANVAVDSAQTQLTLIQEYLAQQAAAQALASARAHGTIFLPVPGPVFTEDTDLTQPSGENAQTINTFLSGTGLAGLGSSYMQAEQQNGVNAVFLVALSVLESGWGDSAIAQDKHNIFGFGAFDANPYGDATTFPSFDACIQYVSQYIKVNYLTPGAAYYHGPTLRGMNVDYASDPNWAVKIASIADTIPVPAGSGA